jgi:hypothetical protein
MAETRETLLKFLTPDGRRKRIRIPLRLLATDGAEVIRRVKAAGVQIAPGADDLVLMHLSDQISRLSEGAQ